MTEQELIDNFSLFTDWEEKYQYLIELGQSLPPMPEEDKTEAHKVQGCQSQVWITAQQKGDKFFFVADSDAFIVRGLEAILLSLINGQTAAFIRELDIERIFKDLGLEDHLSPTRRNGFFSMVERVRSLVAHA